LLGLDPAWYVPIVINQVFNFPKYFL